MHKLAISLLAASSPAFLWPHIAPEQIRIVDGDSGKPLEHATFWLLEESPTPIGGEFWYSLQIEADYEGRVKVPNDQLANSKRWCFVDAQGYSPEMIPVSDLGNQVPLVRGHDVEVQLIDVFERPVVGADLAWVLGCGHMPDSRNAVSDENGIALLRSVDPERDAEWWVSGSGVLADYMSPEWSDDRTKALLRCEPGLVQQGKVLGHDGLPLAGAFVGQPNRHRGPWSRTDADGNFRLYGAAVSDLWVRDKNGQDLTVAPGCVAGFERRIDLSRPAESTTPFNVKLVASESSRAADSLSGVPVRLVRKRDGWNTRARANADGAVELKAPVGSYSAVAGSRLGSFFPAEFNVELTGQEAQEHQVELSRRAAARVHMPDRLKAARIFLATATEQRMVADQLDALCFPSEACVLRYLTPTGMRTYHVKAEDRLPGAIINL